MVISLSLETEVVTTSSTRTFVLRSAESLFWEKGGIRLRVLIRPCSRSPPDSIIRVILICASHNPSNLDDSIVHRW